MEVAEMLISLSSWLQKHINWKHIFLLIAADITILAVMGIVLIPLICETTGGMRILDLKSTGYNLEYVQAFFNAMGDRGRRLYVIAQLPLDFIYPLVYGSLYITLANKAYKKLNIPVVASIIILCLSDYAENSFAYIMLTSNTLSKTVVTAASVCTVVKTNFLYITVFLIAYGAAFEFIKTKRAKQNLNKLL